jgi:hypothetical protein
MILQACDTFPNCSANYSSPNLVLINFVFVFIAESFNGFVTIFFDAN